MLPSDTTFQETSRQAVFERNRLAFEARWGRWSTPHVATGTVRRDPALVGPFESLQLLSQSGSWVRVHSGRDPEGEAARWLDDTLRGRPLPSAVCVIGAGLGYVVDVIEARAPQTRILVVEPEPGLVPYLLGRRDWSALIESGRLLPLWAPAFAGASEAWRIIEGEDQPLILSHPVLTRERPEAALEAVGVVRRAANDWKANKEARDRFAGRYLFNTLRNLPLFETAGDVSAMTGACRGVPAIIAAAGPSLNRNLDELSALGPLRERAVVLCVDTALRPCLAAGIEPHFAVAVDPAEANARHLIDPGACANTWLVAEPSVEPAAFEAFQDRTLLFRVAEHHPWPWLRSQGIERGKLRVWGSVLTAAVDFALKLGCDPIVLIGADLAYTDGQPYCRGTAYEADWDYAMARGHSLEEVWRPWLKEPGFEAADANGVPARTTSYLIAFRDWLAELSVREAPRRFVNATGAGVLYGGAFRQQTVTQVLSEAVQHVKVPYPQLPQAAEASGSKRVAPLEEWLANGLSGFEGWESMPGVSALTHDFSSMADRSIEEFHLRRTERVDGPAAPAIQSEIDSIRGQLSAVQVADHALSVKLAAFLESEGWRAWPFVEQVRLLASICELYSRDRSRLAALVYPGLTEVLRSVLTPGLHVGHAALLYDHLHSLRLAIADHPGDRADFRADVVEPAVRHARGWADQLRLAPRRTPGKPPYRVAYLGLHGALSHADSVTRLMWSLTNGHARLASERFQWFYYAWNGIPDAYRQELEAQGVTVRVYELMNRPCATVARLRGQIAADGIDALLTNMNTGLPTALFETRAAPVQMFLDVGFPVWGGQGLDYTLLGFAGDPEVLDLNPTQYERIDYHFDPQFIYATIDPAAVAQQRARFGGARHVYGLVGRLVKLDSDYFRAVREMLERVPDAAFYLGGTGDDSVIRDVLSSFGRAADRVIVDAGLVDGQLMVRAIDTFLDTFPFFGGLSCLQAQGAGRPVVYRANPRPGFARFLSVMRDSALRARNLGEYVELAVRLANDPDEYAMRAREAERIALCASDVTSTAASIEDAIDRLLRRGRNRE
jgi:hypothetical protein